MRLVVADATPLHYLILIDSANVLPTLFQTIHLPIEVRDELTCDAAPESVRKWFRRPPEWLEIHNPPLPAQDEPALSALHAGERAAILLAQFLSAKLLLIDDRAGAAAAQRLGFATAGTLAVLDLASRRNLLDLHSVFARLRQTNFRYPPSLLQRLIDEEKVRRSKGGS